MSVIALDIGGTNTRAALIDDSNKIVRSYQTPTPRGDKEAFLTNIVRTVREGLGDISGVTAIGGGLPGRVRADGYVYGLPNVGISDIALGDYLRKEFGLPVKLANDAEIAALAEANLGIYKDEPSLYFITISTGVGGALTVGGRLKQSSYEVGHTVFPFGGKYIEFEKYCSGGGIVNMASLNGLKVENTKAFFDEVRNGNPLALETKKQWLSLLSSFFNMIKKDYDPAVFTITGGVSKSSDCFLEELSALCPSCRIELCSFKEEAGLQGGAVLARQS